MVSTARVERDTIPSKLARLLSSGTVPVSGLTAAVERAHSDRARSGSKRPIRALFLPLYRGGSASIETIPAASPSPMLPGASPRQAT
jgi:hypothetical protein